MRVAVSPSAASATQSYIALLYDACSEVEPSLELVEFPTRSLAAVNADIVHVHWPENAAHGRFVRSVVKIVLYQVNIRLARRRGARVVWTVHNLQAHRSVNPRLERVHLWLLARASDGLVLLNSWSRNEILKTLPSLRRVPWAIARIGPYPPVIARVPQDRPDGARARLLFFGALRLNKGIDDLIEAARICGLKLQVLGSNPDPALKSVLAGLSEDSRTDGYTDAQLVDAAAQSDVAVFPFTQMTNSSSVVHALSLGLPVIAPRLPSLIELQEIVGASWVYLYPVGRLSPEALQWAANWVIAQPRQRPPNLDPLSWGRAAEATIDLYRRTRDRS